jgi:hypothetical protein
MRPSARTSIGSQGGVAQSRTAALAPRTRMWRRKEAELANVRVFPGFAR